MTKELVEADWIKLYDSVKALDRPLHSIKNKENFSKATYGRTLNEIEYNKKYKHTEKNKEYRRTYYHNRKKRGLCPACGKKPETNHVLCDKCIEKRRKQ